MQKIKKSIVFLLCVVLVLTCFPINAFAATTEGGIQYEDIDDGSISITGYIGDNTSVIIPEEINNKIVTEIGDHAFLNNETIKTVELPSTCTTIGIGAFDSSSIRTLILNNIELKEIGNYAFSYCMYFSKIQYSTKLLEEINAQYENSTFLEGLIKNNNYINADIIGEEAFKESNIAVRDVILGKNTESDSNNTLNYGIFRDSDNYKDLYILNKSLLPYKNDSEYSYDMELFENIYIFKDSEFDTIKDDFEANCDQTLNYIDLSKKYIVEDNTEDGLHKLSTTEEETLYDDSCIAKCDDYVVNYENSGFYYTITPTNSDNSVGFYVCFFDEDIATSNDLSVGKWYIYDTSNHMFIRYYGNFPYDKESLTSIYSQDIFDDVYNSFDNTEHQLNSLTNEQLSQLEYLEVDEIWDIASGSDIEISYMNDGFFVNDYLNSKYYAYALNDDLAKQYGVDVYTWYVQEETLEKYTGKFPLNTDDLTNIYSEDILNKIIKSFLPAAHTHNYVETITKKACAGQEGIKTYTCSICDDTYTEVIPKTNSHEYDKGKVTKEPTCLEEGIKAYTCSICGDTYTESIPKIDHQYDSGKVTKEPTCLEEGIKTYTCSICGDTYTEVIPKIDHQYGTIYSNNNGTHSKRCKYCDDTITEDCTYSSTKINPTCVDDGYTKYTCTECGYSFKGDFVKCNGFHNYSNKDVSVDKYTGELNVTSICSVCGEKETVVKEITDDTLEYGYTDNGDGTISLTSSCIGKNVDNNADVLTIPSEIDGKVVTAIGNEKSENAISTRYIGEGKYNEISYIIIPNTVKRIYKNAIISCNLNNITILNKDCILDKESITKDSNNRYKYEFRIASYGENTSAYNYATTNNCYGYTDLDNSCEHNLGDSYYENSVVSDYSASMVGTDDCCCAESGTCKICGKYVTIHYSHDYNRIEAVPSTCSSYGYEVYECQNCGYKKTVELNYYADHKYVCHKVAPTCTEAGYTEYVCSVCGTSYKDSYVKSNGHDYKYISNNDGTHIRKCATCEDIDETHSGDCNYSYKYNENNTHTPYCAYCGYKKEPEPCKYTKNKELTYYSVSHKVKISSACECCNNINTEFVDNLTVKLGDNIYATLNVASGELVVSGAGDITIPFNNKAFANYLKCNVIGMASETDKRYDSDISHLVKNIVIEEGITSICNDAFKYTAPTSVSLPDSLISIGDNAFSITVDNKLENNVKYAPIENLIIPDNVKYIGKNAFASSSISYLYIPKSMEYIGDSAFYNCKNLKFVCIDDCEKLTLGKYVFANCTSLHYLRLPDCIEEIPDYAFINCRNILPTQLPNSLKRIGKYAFAFNRGSVYDYTASLLSFGNGGCQGGIIPYLADKETKFTDFVFSGYSNGDLVEPIDMYYKIGDKFFRISDFGVKRLKYENGILNETLELYFDSNINCPSSLIEIDDGAFADSSITSVDLNEGLEKIGNGAFTNTSLTDIKIPSTVTDLGFEEYNENSDVFNQYDKYDSETFKNDIEKRAIYAKGAFRNAEALVNIEVSLDNKVFSSKNGLLYNNDKSVLINCPEGIAGNVNIEDSVNEIRPCAFYCCNDITSVKLPDGVTSLPEGVFYDCFKLSDINEENITEYGILAFFNCIDLESVDFNEDLTNIYPYAFAFSGIKELNLPSSINTLPEGVFYGCFNLTSVIIPKTIKNIHYNVFSICSNLKEVYILNPDIKVTTARYYKFMDGVVDNPYNSYLFENVLNEYGNEVNDVYCNPVYLDFGTNNKSKINIYSFKPLYNYYINTYMTHGTTETYDKETNRGITKDEDEFYKFADMARTFYIFYNCSIVRASKGFASSFLGYEFPEFGSNDLAYYKDGNGDFVISSGKNQTIYPTNTNFFNLYEQEPVFKNNLSYDLTQNSVNYDVNNEFCNETVESQYIISIDDSISLTAPILKDFSTDSTTYSFIGWNTKEDGSGDFIMVGDTYSSHNDITYYGIWNKKAIEKVPVVEPIKEPVNNPIKEPEIISEKENNKITTNTKIETEEEISQNIEKVETGSILLQVAFVVFVFVLILIVFFKKK